MSHPKPHTMTDPTTGLPTTPHKAAAMRLVVFGGTGGVGRHIITQALDAGHDVVAFARNPSGLPRAAKLTVIEGQLNDAEAIAAAIEGADAVLSALGARVNAPDQVEVFGAAMKHITSAMQRHGVRRLVAISGAVVVLTPDDRMTLGRRLVRFALTRLRKHVAQAKAREYAIITATDLEWVLVRPPRVVPRAATGSYRVFPDRPPSSTIAQGDVADLMLTCTTGHDWVHKAPIPGY